MQSAFINYKSEPKFKIIGTSITITYGGLSAQSMFDSGLHLCFLSILTGDDVGLPMPTKHDLSDSLFC
jgi:hypothetical protein